MQVFTNKLYIWPADGIILGEDKLREIPLQGYFAIKFGRAHLERALSVWIDEGNLWSAKIDGFLIAPRSLDWRKSFGEIYERAERRGSIMLLGRRLSRVEHDRLVKARAADTERGIDLSAGVDLNTVEIPTF